MCPFQRARASLFQRAQVLLVTTSLCLLVLGTATRLHAQSASWSLEWAAPRGCPSKRAVEDRIRARLSAEETASVRAKVNVDRRGGAFRVRIRLSGAVNAERMLEAESCDVAADATALLITLAIQPDALTTSDGSSESSSATTVAGSASSERAVDGGTSSSAREGGDNATTAPVNDSASDREPEADAEDEGDVQADQHADGEDDVEEDAASANDSEPSAPLVWAWDAGLGVAFDGGTLPGPTLGGLLQVNLAISHVLLSLSGNAWLARSASVASDASVSVGWISAALDGCYLRGDTLQLGPCLGVELGRYSWSADGLVNDEEGRELAAFASATFTGRARLTNALFAALWVGMRTSLSYPELLVVGAGEVFSPAPLGFRAAFVLTLVLG